MLWLLERLFWKSHPGYEGVDVEGLKARRKLWDLFETLTQENTLWVILPEYSCVSPGAWECRWTPAHTCEQEVLGRKSRDATCMPLSSQVWFQGTRGRVALEGSCYADPHSSPKRITGFAALSAHPDGIQGSFDSPEQALQLLCHPPNLPDLNLLLPSREESWRVDTFNFHILHKLIKTSSNPELHGTVRDVPGVRRRSIILSVYYKFHTSHEWSLLAPIHASSMAGCDQPNNGFLAYSLFSAVLISSTCPWLSSCV